MTKSHFPKACVAGNWLSSLNVKLINKAHRGSLTLIHVKLNLYQQTRIQLRPEFSLSNSMRQDLLAKKIKVLLFKDNDFDHYIPNSACWLLWSAGRTITHLSFIGWACCWPVKRGGSVVCATGLPTLQRTELFFTQTKNDQMPPFFNISSQREYFIQTAWGAVNI